MSTDPKKERENYCVFEKYHSLYKHCAITVICTVYVHYLTITRTQNFYNMPKGNDYAPYSFLPDCSIKVSNRLSKSTQKKNLLKVNDDIAKESAESQFCARCSHYIFC